jgi:hypothetical protein
MATRNENLQRLWHQFERETGAPAGTRAVVQWALARGLLDVPRIDPVAVLADEMARALREEYRTDSRGRRYRVNHSVKPGGVQPALWAELESAPRDHMIKSFAQRRRQVVGDCVQLQTDVDAFNAMHRKEEPFQLVLDFSEDVAEVLGRDAA